MTFVILNKNVFRFWKNGIYELSDVLDLSDEIITGNRQNVYKIETLCILLKTFAYPCRYGDLVLAEQYLSSVT